MESRVDVGSDMRSMNLWIEKNVQRNEEVDEEEGK